MSERIQIDQAYYFPSNQFLFVIQHSESLVRSPIKDIHKVGQYLALDLHKYDQELLPVRSEKDRKGMYTAD